MRLTVITVGDTLEEELSFDLPLFEIKAIALHPVEPVLFCVTGDDRLLIIDTTTQTIAGETRLDDKALDRRHVDENPIAMSPSGEVLAIANEEGTVSILTCGRVPKTEGRE